MNQQTFLENLELLRRQEALTTPRFPPDKLHLWPLLSDDTAQTDFDHHYVYHTAWAARRLRNLAPAMHVDFGSSVYFAAIASAIVPIAFYDYRPVLLELEGVQSGRADLLHLNFASGSLPSVSCMHVVEHIGLGRYGDPIDYDGDLKAMRELERVVANSGSLLFVVPVGGARLVYNAHRIYAWQQILDIFSPSFDLVQSALITDQGNMVQEATRELADAQAYGCGCFHFIKR